MSNLISHPPLIHATMLRMCFWLMSIGLAVTANKAQSEEGSFATDLDILSIQPVRSGAGGLFPYRFKTDVVLARPDNATPAGSGLSNTLRLRLVTKPKEEVVWPANSRWQISNSDRASLSPVLHFESKGERIEIKPRHHSIWVVWHKAFN